VSAELAWTVAYLALSALLISLLGLDGAGIAFFLSYVVHGAVVYPIARSLSGFRWSNENIGTALLMVAAIALVSSSFRLLPNLPATVLGLCITALSFIHTVRSLIRLTLPDIRVSRILQRLHRGKPRL
jgi:PST family polysaccharide transporter